MKTNCMKCNATVEHTDVQTCNNCSQGYCADCHAGHDCAAEKAAARERWEAGRIR